MTPEERAEMNVSLNRDWNTDEQIRKQIAAEIEAYASERVAVSQAVDAACKKCNRAVSAFCRECYDAEIRAAVEEDNKLNCAKCIDLGYRGGKAEAYEDAAKIAEKTAITRNGVPEFYLTDLAKVIRARAAEVGK